IAFWNAPTYQYDHAKRALEAAIECQQKLKEMQAQLSSITGKAVKQRIGLNTGIATVGNFGSNKRFDYTMMGDTVNLASRLEGINKQFGTYTMCSEQTMKRATEVGCQLAFRNIANIVVVGRREPVHVYTPMEQSEAKNSEAKFKKFEKAYELFVDGKFSEAKTLFEQNKDDAVSLKYVDKCEKFLRQPPEGWQGFLHATQK
nr:adenylate/guanylate cyclase domain-containing protein [Treponema sp.]